MAKIIAGLFETLAEAEKAEIALKNDAFEKSDVSVFALNPPGQHALYPIGGDQDADPGASEAHAGAALGAVVGASAALGVGAAATAATGAAPAAVAMVAAGVGAYTGALVGALNRLGDASNEAEPAPSIERRAGVMVAINAPNEKAQARAITLLRAHGAQHVEQAEGDWRNGEWVDFDPRNPVSPADSPPETAKSQSRP